MSSRDEVIRRAKQHREVHDQIDWSIRGLQNTTLEQEVADLKRRISNLEIQVSSLEEELEEEFEEDD